LRFMVWGSGFRIYGLGHGFEDLGFTGWRCSVAARTLADTWIGVLGSAFRVDVLGFRVWGLGCRVLGLGFRMWG